MDFTTKIRKEISDILEEIRAGDVMTLISGFSAAVILAAIIYFITQREYLFALILAILSIPSTLILTIVTKMIIKRLSSALFTTNKEIEEHPKIKLIPLILKARYPLVNLEIKNLTRNEITECYANLVSLVGIYGSKRDFNYKIM